MFKLSARAKLLSANYISAQWQLPETVFDAKTTGVFATLAPLWVPFNVLVVSLTSFMSSEIMALRGANFDTLYYTCLAFTFIRFKKWFTADIACKWLWFSFLYFSLVAVSRHRHLPEF